MLQRRRFLGLLAAVAASILSLARSLRPSSWWRRPTRSVQQSAATEHEPGVKITTIHRSTFRNSGGDVTDLSSEPDIFYLQGERRRIEYHRGFSGGSTDRIHGPRIISILRPDLGQMFELNLDASQYTQMSYPPSEALIKKLLQAQPTKMASRGEQTKPTFRIETLTNDTGERKPMFGYLARHVITTRKEIPLEGSRRNAHEMTRDGWYIDLEPQLYPSLYPPKPPAGKLPQSGRVHAYLSVSSHRPGEQPKEEQEVPSFVDVGEPETGFAVQELSSISFTLPDGTKTQTENKSETVVTIEKGVFESALFEVPSGFKRVSQINRNPA